ncbi:MAG: tetratricopeptide repeat protein [Bacillota bacterium]
MIDGLRQALLDGRHAEAWRIYDQLREAGEPGPETHLLGGRAALARGDLHGARTALERALEAGAAGEARGQALLVLGDVRRRLGEPIPAAATLEEFLAGMDAEYPELGRHWRAAGLYNLGLTYRQLHRLEEAVAAYREAAAESGLEALTDLQARSLWNLAWVLTLQGDTQRAREALAESEQIRRDEWARWHQLIGWAFIEAVEGRTARVSELTGRILRSETAPADVRAHACWLLGREALRMGDVQAAINLADGGMAEALNDLGDNRAYRDSVELWQEARRRQMEMADKAEGA